jgi:hypothetical protein
MRNLIVFNQVSLDSRRPPLRLTQSRSFSNGNDVVPDEREA